MATLGGCVQLEQSDMRLALNIANMAKGMFSQAPIEETQFAIKKPRAEVREQKMWGVEIPGHNKVKAGIERHPAMLGQNYRPGILPSQNVTAKIIV
jgi:hypothetical protein